MTKLNCSAQNCTHNFSNCCCINQINVGGKEASVAQSTCCDSFQEAQGAFTNSSKSPNANLNISCEAGNCIHNCDSNCEAHMVDIDGITACESGETKCSSFCCK